MLPSRAFVACSVVSLLILIGCGDDGGSSGAGGTSTTSASTATASTATGSSSSSTSTNVTTTSTSTTDSSSSSGGGGAGGEGGAGGGYTGSLLWSKQFGDAGDQYGHATASDPAGNVLVTGTFQGAVDFGGGPLTSAGDEDVFLAKLDPAGSHLWSKRFGDASSQRGQSVATDAAGNVLVAGSFYGEMDCGGGPLTSGGTATDIFVAKYDAAGNHLWSKRFGNDDFQYANSVATDAAGNVLVTGYFYGTADFGGGSLVSAGAGDVFIAKFDAAGDHLWSKRFGGVANQEASSVTTDAAGNVLVAGHFFGSLDFGGGPITSVGSYDIFVVKLNAAGDQTWSQRFGDATDQRGQSIATDAAGNAILTGYFYGTLDFGGGPLASAGSADVYVAKLDGSGSHLWSQRFGGGASQYGYSVASDTVGSVLVTGYFDGTADFGGGPLTSAGNGDIFVAKLDASGSHLWSQRFGDASNQMAYGVAVDLLDNVLLTGSFAGTVDFGGGALVSNAGSDDLFLVKLAP